MPSRVVPFVNDEYYHIFNRGVAKLPIYSNEYDYRHFFNTALYYRVEGPKPRFSFFRMKPVSLAINGRLVEIVSYCLMPNHFHFLLQQKIKNGITEFLSKLSNSYTKYFNTKYKRVGPLLQGEFKSVHVDTNEQLIHLSRYIHLNPIVSYITGNLRKYRWSSYQEYLGIVNSSICSKEIILGQFRSVNDYEKFVLDQIGYAQKLEHIKHKLIDLEE